MINDVGAEHFAEFNKRIWEVDLERGLRLLQLAIDTHLISSHVALPLLTQSHGGLVVVTDGAINYNFSTIGKHCTTLRRIQSFAWHTDKVIHLVQVNKQLSPSGRATTRLIVRSN